MEVESIVNSKRRSVKLEECFSVNASNTSNGSCTSSDTDSTLGHAALLGRMLGRKRKKFVGIRQRPSGRWVAEIKDTIQKIRLWLGTFDTAEDAARAYDEAACILRGKNTRTNFWPSPSAEAHGTSVLPSRTARMLQLRLKEAKARNNNDGMISDTNDTNSSMDHSLCNQFMHSKLNLEAEMPSLEEDNISETETSQIHSLTPGMSSMDVILHSTVPNKPHAAANDSNEEKYLEDQDGFVNPSLPIEPNIRIGQRDANKGASQLVPTNPKRALPQFIQKTILNPRVVHTNPTKDFLQLVQKTFIIPRAVQRNPNEDFSQLLEDKDGSLNPSSPTINSRMGQRNPSNGAFEMIETNPNKKLPQLLQKNYCSVEGGEEKGNLSSSSNLMETDDITPVECMNREDTHITSSLHGVITEMDNDFDFIDVSDLASGYSPFAIAEEMAEPVNTNSCMHNVFMVDEASGCNGFLQSLEEQHSSMFREAINRRMYERKISASLYAMIGVSEYFHYTSERS